MSALQTSLGLAVEKGIWHILMESSTCVDLLCVLSCRRSLPISHQYTHTHGHTRRHTHAHTTTHTVQWGVWLSGLHKGTHIHTHTHSNVGCGDIRTTQGYTHTHS